MGPPAEEPGACPLASLAGCTGTGPGEPLLSPRQGCLPFLQALEKHCRTEAGFSGIQDVYSSIPNHDNKQQTFFLAETLK